MDRAEKDRLKRYGNLVVDFANSSDTDKIIMNFFNNLRSVFNFSSDFTDKALTQRPTMCMFWGNLTEGERDLLKSVVRKNEAIQSCCAACSTSVYAFDGYDPKNQTFTISEKLYTGVGGDFESDTTIVSGNEIEGFIDSMSLPDDVIPAFKEDVAELVEIYCTLENIYPVTTSRHEIIEKMAKTYPKILAIHDHIKKLQGSLWEVLIQITESKNAYKTDGFKMVLSRYNRIQKEGFLVNDNNDLIEIGPFTESLFLDKDFIIHKEKMFNDPIVYCLVEFLKDTENIKYLKRCFRCGEFYIATRLRKDQKRCSVCSKKTRMTQDEQKAYQKKYRSTPARKRAKANKKREGLIQHYMENAGKTRKEAEIIIETD